MKPLVLSLSLVAFAAALNPTFASVATPPRILAVFAHPDDEALVAPALANAAARGAHVRIVYATRGDASAPQTNLTSGPAIAARRSEEARCASRELGLAEPVLLDFGDGRLNEVVRQDRESSSPRLFGGLSAVIADERPDVIITWGPDGGYGHSDHRLVAAITTQIVAAQSKRPLLLYSAIERGTLPVMPQIQAMGWAETAPDLLTVRVRYTPADLAASARAFTCHASQYDAASRAALVPVFGGSIWRDGVPFRPALDRAEGGDLLALRR